MDLYKAIIATSKESFQRKVLNIPIPLFENINDVLNFDGYIAVIGTPCQIAGIRLMQKENKF